MSQFQHEDIIVKKIKTLHGAEWMCPMCYTVNTMRFKNCHICSSLRVGRKYAISKNGGGKPDTLTQDRIAAEVKRMIEAGTW